jgi:hypothetical protein
MGTVERNGGGPPVRTYRTVIAPAFCWLLRCQQTEMIGFLGARLALVTVMRVIHVLVRIMLSLGCTRCGHAGLTCFRQPVPVCTPTVCTLGVRQHVLTSQSKTSESRRSLRTNEASVLRPILIDRRATCDQVKSHILWDVALHFHTKYILIMARRDARRTTHFVSPFFAFWFHAHTNNYLTMVKA